jgi:hypothetical protein
MSIIKDLIDSTVNAAVKTAAGNGYKYNPFT